MISNWVGLIIWRKHLKKACGHHFLPCIVLHFCLKSSLPSKLKFISIWFPPLLLNPRPFISLGMFLYWLVRIQCSCFSHDFFLVYSYPHSSLSLCDLISTFSLFPFSLFLKYKILKFNSVKPLYGSVLQQWSSLIIYI